MLTLRTGKFIRWLAFKLMAFIILGVIFSGCGLRSYRETILRNDLFQGAYDSYEIPVYIHAIEKVVKKKSNGLSSDEFEKLSGMQRTVSQALWEEIGGTAMTLGVNQLLKLSLIGIKDKEFEIPGQELSKRILSGINEKYRLKDYSTQFKKEKDFVDFMKKNNEKMFIQINLTYCSKVQGEYHVTSRGTSIVTSYYYIPAISSRITIYGLDKNKYGEIMMHQTTFFSKIIEEDRKEGRAYFEKKEVIFNRAINNIHDVLNKFLKRQYPE